MGKLLPLVFGGAVGFPGDSYSPELCLGHWPDLSERPCLGNIHWLTAACSVRAGPTQKLQLVQDSVPVIGGREQYPCPKPQHCSWVFTFSGPTFPGPWLVWGAVLEPPFPRIGRQPLLDGVTNSLKV